MADWRKVMFFDEGTSRLVLRGYKLVRRPSEVSRYDSRYIIKTVNTPKVAKGQPCTCVRMPKKLPGLKPHRKCLELYEKQGSGSTFHKYPDVKGSPDKVVGPYRCRIFSEVRRINAIYIA